MLALLMALLASTSALQTSAPPPGDAYIARTWGTADGLPQNTVTSIVQTRDGYLWLGTFGGLVRFDGNAFTVFDPDNTPGLASARITALHEDRRGVLWIGTETGLTKYDGGGFTSYTTRDGLPHLNILALLADTRGRLWIGTGDGLARFDGRTFERVPLDPLSPVALALAQTPDGDVWVSATNGILRFRAGDAPSVVSSTYATMMLVDAKGRLWLGGPAVMRWDPSTGSGRGGRFVDVELTSPHHQLGEVAGVLEDRDGALWIGTTGGGIYRAREGMPAEAVVEGTTGAVRGLRADRDGNIWFGTDVGGLTRLKSRHVFSYPQAAATSQSVGPVVGDGGDGLWVGGTCGDLVHFRAGAFDRPVLSGCTWTLLRDPDGTLWRGGSADAGLQRIAGERLTSYKRSDGVDYNIVTAIARDRDGVLWVGHEAGLSRFEEGRFTDVGRDAGLQHRVVCIEQDRGGALWVGGADGIYRLSGGGVTHHYTKADGLSHNHVRAIHEDADGVLWIGTYGGGLNRLKNGRFTSYGPKEGLPDTAVSRIIEDERGNLWMSGNKGVFRVARSQLNDFADGRSSYLTSVTYGTADGMIIAETNGGFPAGWRTPDGRLWFPTIKGLVGIEPTTAAAAAPSVVVEHAIANGRRVDRGALASLGPGNVDAEFHFTAIDLGAGEKTRFRYRLANYDPAWIDSGTRRVAYYTRLPPGSYQFEVIATDSEGAWSTTPARIAVVVTPFWWQRRSAMIAGLVLLLAATGLAVRHVSLRRARARVAELERERALERERSRIARDLHDDLGAHLSHIAIMADASATDGTIAREARAAVQKMDELVWAVNARNDTLESFAYYVAQFAEERAVHAGLRCRLLLPPELPARALNAEVRRHLYLAVKEAINNAIKHAKASELRLSLHVEAGRLAVGVADDGRGLPPEIDPTGNGLKNLRERMDAVGGTLDVHSMPGSGTQLTFTAPL